MSNTKMMRNKRRFELAVTKILKILHFKIETFLSQYFLYIQISPIFTST